MARTSKKKNSDITQTGALTWRDLQQLNAGRMVSPEELAAYQEANNIVGARQAAAYNISRAAQVADTKVQTPLYQASEGTDWLGRSMFDNDIYVGDSELERATDIRAENQPWYSKLAAGTGKMAVTALTTIGETAGLFYGLGQGLYNLTQGDSFLQGLWDNPITQGLQKINEVAEEVMPNYYTQAELEDPLGHLLSWNTISDKIIKNLGFMIGVYYGGIPYTKLISAGSKATTRLAKGIQMAKEAGRDVKAAKIMAQYGDDIAGAEKALGKAGLTIAEREKMAQAGIERLNKFSQASKATSQLFGAFGSAVSEASIEALNNSTQALKEMVRDENDRYNQEVLQVEATLGSDTPEAVAAKVKLRDEHEKRLDIIEQSKTNIGNADFIWNLPILTLSNFIQYGKLYARGFESSQRTMGSFWNGYKLPGELAKGTIKGSKSITGGIMHSLYKMHTEGLEEYLQRAASDSAQKTVKDAINRYFEAGQDGEWQDYINGYISNFAQSVGDNLSNPSAMEEYIIGAVSSALGMPVTGTRTKDAWLGKNKKIGLAGGLVGNFLDYKQQMDEEKRVAEHLNNLAKNGAYKPLYEHLIKTGKLQDLINGTLKEEDKKAFNDLNWESIFEDINAAASANHLGEYKALIGYNREYDDKELDEIVKLTTNTVTAKELEERDRNKLNFYDTRIAQLEKRKAESEKEEHKKEADKWFSKVDQLNLDDYKKKRKDLAEHIAKTTYKDTIEGAFVETDANGNPIFMNATDKGKQRMREKLEENRKNLLDMVDRYVAIRNQIDRISDGVLDDKEITLLTKMQARIENIENRGGGISARLGESFGVLKNRLEEEIQEAQDTANKLQSEYDELGEKIKEADSVEEDKKDKKEIRRLKIEQNEKSKNLSRAKEAIASMEKMLSTVRYFRTPVSTLSEEGSEAERKKRSFSERLAFNLGAKRNIVSSLYDATFNRKNHEYTRTTNAEEGTAAILFTYRDIMDAIHHPWAELTNEEQERLSEDATDLFRLAADKMAYNEKLREFLGDFNRIAAAEREGADELKKEERDNKVDEAADAFKKAKNMSDLHNLMQNATKYDARIAEQALKKAQETADEETKKLLADYQEGLAYYENFLKALRTFKGEGTLSIDGFDYKSIYDTAEMVWEESLAVGLDIRNNFIEGMQESADALEETGVPGYIKRANIIRQIMKDLQDAANSVASNSRKNVGKSKETKPSDSSSKEGPAASESEEKPDVKPEEQQKGDTVESLTKEIEDAIWESYDEDNNTFTILKYEDLQSDSTYSDLVKRIKKFSEDNADKLDDAKLKEIFKEALRKQVERYFRELEQGSDEDGDGELDGEYDDGVFHITSRAEKMSDNVRSSFTSTRISMFQYGKEQAQAYKPSEMTPQQKAIQDLLIDMKAYRFVDRNYLGYILRENEGFPLKIHFLKSIDPKVNGNDGTEATIFMAIEIGEDERNAIKKRAYGVKKRGPIKDANIDNAFNLVSFTSEENGKSVTRDYQIVGVMSYSKSVDPRVKDAFDWFQGEINRELEDKEANSQGFKLSKYYTTTDEIYTGRLEKVADNEEKVGLYEFLTQSENPSDNDAKEPPSEFSSGCPIYFGVVVNNEIPGYPEEEVYPNKGWMAEKNHQGAVVMAIPKADGHYYPIRLTRKSVKDWLLPGYEAGEELIKKILNQDAENEYLERIIYNLKVLFDEKQSLPARIKAKMELTNYFVFGKQDPIHFEEGISGITLRFRYSSGVDRELTIDKGDLEENVLTFFGALSDENVLFTLPRNSEINSDDIVRANIFEVGLRSFYNFNSNFTVRPVIGWEEKDDGKGGKTEAPVYLNVQPATSSSLELGEGNPENIDLDFGNGLKTYVVHANGDVYLDGKKVDAEIQKLVNAIRNIKQQSAVDWCVAGNSTASDRLLATEELQNALEALRTKYNGLYYLEIDGVGWLYDERIADHNKRLVKVFEHGNYVGGEYAEMLAEIMDKVNNALTVAAIHLADKMVKEFKAASSTPAVPTSPATSPGTDGGTGSKGGTAAGDKGPSKSSPPAGSTFVGRYAGKTMGDMSSNSEDLLTATFSDYRTDTQVQKIFAAVQAAEAAGVKFDSDAIADAIGEMKELPVMEQADEAERIINEEINGCNKPQ